MEVTEFKTRQIIKKGDGGLRLNTSELRPLLCETDLAEKPLAVIGIAGPMRSGKSFLLNFLLRYLREKESKYGRWLGDDNTKVNEGFEWRFGRVPHTDGIHIWNEVFTVKKKDGKEIGILIKSKFI